MKYIRIGPIVIVHKKTLDPVRLAVDTALGVGEIHFEICALAAGAKQRLRYAMVILDRLTGRLTYDESIAKIAAIDVEVIQR